MGGPMWEMVVKSPRTMDGFITCPKSRNFIEHNLFDISMILRTNLRKESFCLKLFAQSGG